LRAHNPLAIIGIITWDRDPSLDKVNRLRTNQNPAAGSLQTHSIKLKGIDLCSENRQPIRSSDSHWTDIGLHKLRYTCITSRC